MSLIDELLCVVCFFLYLPLAFYEDDIKTFLRESRMVAAGAIIMSNLARE